MSQTEQFLTPAEEQQIIDAIIQAEEQTSGEIRVHIEETNPNPALERAQEIFAKLEMHQTQARNGVLFYVNVQQHQFAILGDEGINAVVPDDFWECTKDLIINHFKTQEYALGLIKGITNAGEQLKKYFPKWEGNPNELPNEITRS